MKPHPLHIVARALELRTERGTSRWERNPGMPFKRTYGYIAISKILWREYRVMVSPWTVRDWCERAKQIESDTQGRSTQIACLSR